MVTYVTIKYWRSIRSFEAEICARIVPQKGSQADIKVWISANLITRSIYDTFKCNLEDSFFFELVWGEWRLACGFPQELPQNFAIKRFINSNATKTNQWDDWKSREVVYRITCCEFTVNNFRIDRKVLTNGNFYDKNWTQVWVFDRRRYCLEELVNAKKDKDVEK